MNGLFLSPIEVNLRHLYDTKMSVGIIKMNPIPKNINPYFHTYPESQIVQDNTYQQKK